MKHDCIGPLIRAGIEYEDALALRRIAMTLRRWHELECGGEHGWIERDEKGAPYYHDCRARYLDPHDPRGRRRIPDREKGALTRIAATLAKYPTLGFYVQGDPRGASLYILRPGDVPEGEAAACYYSRGLAVYK